MTDLDPLVRADLELAKQDTGDGHAMLVDAKIVRDLAQEVRDLRASLTLATSVRDQNYDVLIDAKLAAEAHRAAQTAALRALAEQVQRAMNYAHGALADLRGQLRTLVEQNGGPTGGDEYFGEPDTHVLVRIEDFTALSALLDAIPPPETP